MGIIKECNAKIFLLCNSFLWGASYVFSKMLLTFLPRFFILFICSLGSLTVSFILFFKRFRTIKVNAILPSIIVSILSILSNISFMLALQYTTSSNTAFIVQTSVVLTPLIISIIEKKPPEGKIVFSSLIAMIGLFLITCSIKDFSLNFGDIFAFFNALFFSFFLTGQRYISKKVNALHFSFIHLAFTTIIYALLSGVFEMYKFSQISIKTSMFPFLLAINIFIVCATVLFQSSAIKFIRAEKAVIIYTIEPLTALLLGWVFMGEQINGIRTIIGCLLILLSVVLTNLRLITDKSIKISSGECITLVLGKCWNIKIYKREVIKDNNFERTATKKTSIGHDSLSTNTLKKVL